MIPFTRANAQWVIHGFNKHYNLHFRVNSLFHHFQLLNSCLHKSAIPNNHLNIICLALFSNIFMACTSILGSVASEKLCAALTQNSLVGGIKQGSPFEQTSCLEGFHSLFNQFAPKMIGYSYVGLYCWCVS